MLTTEDVLIPCAVQYLPGHHQVRDFITTISMDRMPLCNLHFAVIDLMAELPNRLIDSSSTYEMEVSTDENKVIIGHHKKRSTQMEYSPMR